MAKIYNNYSQKLVDVFRAKAQKKIIFQVWGIRTDKVTGKLLVPQTSTFVAVDRIFDPYNGESGAMIDIAYITGERPTAPESNRDSTINLGEIVFRRELMGEIPYNSEKNMEQMAMFLFFCNLNETNALQPWHIKPEAGYRYKMLEPDKMATAKLGSERLVDRAKAVIDGMSDDELKEKSKGLFPNEYRDIEKDQVILKLRSIAEKTPEKILNLSKDVDVRTNAFVNDCKEAALIEYDASKGWLWADDKKVICYQKPGQTEFSSIKMFFLTEEGLETVSTLENLLGAKNKKTAEPISITQVDVGFKEAERLQENIESAEEVVKKPRGFQKKVKEPENV